MSRRAAPHRLALVYHLWEYKNQGAMSFDISNYQLLDIAYWHANILYEFPDKEKMDLIKRSLPLILEDGIDPSTNPIVDFSPQKFHDSHLHVVAETYYDCKDTEYTMFFSEKIYKPMQYLQPFVILNYPHSLVELRRQGYQTFDKWLDEGYDGMLNINDRTIAVAQVVKDICKQSPKASAAMHKDMLPVLEHNFHQRISNSTAIDNDMYDLIHNALNSL